MKIEKHGTYMAVCLTFEEVTELGQAHVNEEGLNDLEFKIRDALVSNYCCDDCGEYLTMSMSEHAPDCPVSGGVEDEDDEDDLDFEDEDDDADDDLDLNPI